jgi:mRNA interferase HigB
VRVIARSTLYEFVSSRVQKSDRSLVKSHLDAWFADVQSARWANSADLKRHHRSASIVSAERVVFNIKGNNYRLVVAISYDYQIVLIKWLGTHAEYDEINVKTVQYDKERYANSSDSK